MTEITIGQFLLIIFLILLNAFFVASEFAFVKIRKTRIDTMIEAGSRRARRVKSITNNLDRSLSSTQLGITLASIALGFVGEPFFTEFLLLVIEFFNNLLHLGLENQISQAFNQENGIIHDIAFILGYFFISFGHVVIGELAPKSISIQFAETTALFCAEPLWWFMKITSPILSFFVWSSNGLLSLINVEPATEDHSSEFTEGELKIIIEDSIKQGELEQYESKLIFNILDFTDSNVKSILTPRIDMEALPDSTSPHDILQLSKQTGFSRIPIYEDSLDNIRGFVHIKDIIGYSNGSENSDSTFMLSDVLRPVIMIPEGKPLDDLLKEMQQLKTQVAIIVDEYGSVEGMATIEDILEYIVGPIDDEFDTESNANIKISGDVIIAGGLVSIDAFNSVLNDTFNSIIEAEEAATVAGYVLELFESEIPQEGMIVENNELRFEITKTSGNRIEKVRVSKKNN